jgi:8-oxo-dGTP pyrophosphatase MutT (NUDIX family)
MRYVCGLLFWRGEVLLVRKTRPVWQAGLLNAVGGKVEGHDLSIEAAMAREFEEETGLLGQDWHFLAVETHPDYALNFFSARVLGSDPRPAVPPVNDVGEALEWHTTAALDCPSGRGQMVGNLTWLLPLALDWRMPRAHVYVVANITEGPSWT